MKNWSLVCVDCGRDLGLDYRGFCCSSCRAPIDVRLTLGNETIRDDTSSLWRYRSVLPIRDEHSIVTLGEGMTPVLEETFDNRRVTLKVESLAPTGSFKDRGASVMVSRLREMGVEDILEDSSGNAGCSVAAYASAAGIRCTVLVPESVPQEKATQIQCYGALVERVPGSRDDVADEALRRASSLFYASHNWQPFFLQGTKTFAYEVFEQLRPLPEVILFPIGNGSLIVGSFKGFTEMAEMGWIERIPRLMGVQAVTHPAVYRALTGESPSGEGRDTIAKGIAVDRPVRLKQIAQAIRATGGRVFVVDDEEIRVAQRELARRGYLVEPTSASVLAGYKHWCRAEARPANERTLLPLTGSGLKDLLALEELTS